MKYLILLLLLGCSTTPQERSCMNYCSENNLKFEEALDGGECICKKKPHEIKFYDRVR